MQWWKLEFFFYNQKWYKHVFITTFFLKFFQRYFIYFYGFGSFAIMYTYTPYKCLVPRGHKRVYDPLELELQTIVSCHGCQGTNHPWSPGRAANALSHWAISVPTLTTSNQSCAGGSSQFSKGRGRHQSSQRGGEPFCTQVTVYLCKRSYEIYKVYLIMKCLKLL